MTGAYGSVPGQAAPAGVTPRCNGAGGTAPNPRIPDRQLPRHPRVARACGKHAAGKKYAMRRGGAAHPFVLANCPGTQPAGIEPEYDSGSVTPRKDRPGDCRRRRTRELSDMTRRDAKALPQHTRDAAMDFVLCPAPYHSFKREIFDGVAGLPCPYGGRTASGIPRLSA